MLTFVIYRVWSACSIYQASIKLGYRLCSATTTATINNVSPIRIVEKVNLVECDIAFDRLGLRLGFRVVPFYIIFQQSDIVAADDSLSWNWPGNIFHGVVAHRNVVIRSRAVRSSVRSLRRESLGMARGPTNPFHGQFDLDIASMYAALIWYLDKPCLGTCRCSYVVDDGVNWTLSESGGK